MPRQTKKPVLELHMPRLIEYQIELPDLLKQEFTQEEKMLLRPMAETLALLDGNAFFGSDLGDGREWYEQYLPEAWEVWKANGGMDGWTGGLSWVREYKQRLDNPTLSSIYEQYQIAKRLTEEST